MPHDSDSSRHHSRAGSGDADRALDEFLLEDASEFVETGVLLVPDARAKAVGFTQRALDSRTSDRVDSVHT